MFGLFKRKEGEEKFSDDSCSFDLKTSTAKVNSDYSEKYARQLLQRRLKEVTGRSGFRLKLVKSDMLNHQYEVVA